MVNRLLFLLLVLFSISTANAPQVVTTNALNIREQPNVSSAVLNTIPASTVITLDECEGNWCFISYKGFSGYVNKSYLRSVKEDAKATNEILVRETSPSAVKYYYNSKGKRVQSPTHYDSPPQGATAQCNDGSYSFSQSRRGTCSHHGGVRRWLR